MSYQYSEREVLLTVNATFVMDEYKLHIEDILQTLNNPHEHVNDVPETAVRTLSDTRRVTIRYSPVYPLSNEGRYMLIEEIVVDDR